MSFDYESRLRASRGGIPRRIEELLEDPVANSQIATAAGAGSAPVMVGATGVTNGVAGLAPQPVIGDQTKFLRGDATWQTPAGGGGTVHSLTDVNDTSATVNGQVLAWNATEYQVRTVKDIYENVTDGQAAFSTDASGITLRASKRVKFNDADASAGLSLTAASVMASDVNLTLPAAAPTTGQYLGASSASTLDWITPPADVGFANPMTAVGDVILGGTAGAAERLGIGTSGHVLTSTGTTAAWTALPADVGFANPMTAVGDVILGGTAGAAGRLAIGTNAQVLTSNGTTAAWATPAAGFADPLTTDGDVIARLSGSTTRLARGTTGQVLTSTASTIEWATPSTGGGVSAWAATTAYTTTSIVYVENPSWGLFRSLSNRTSGASWTAVESAFWVRETDRMDDGGDITSSHTIADSEFARFHNVNTSGGAVTLTLPAANGSLQVRRLRLYDRDGTWATNNVTIAPTGADLIRSVNANRVHSTAFMWVEYESTIFAPQQWVEKSWGVGGTDTNLGTTNLTVPNSTTRTVTLGTSSNLDVILDATLPGQFTAGKSGVPIFKVDPANDEVVVQTTAGKLVVPAGTNALPSLKFSTSATGLSGDTTTISNNVSGALIHRTTSSGLQLAATKVLALTNNANTFVTTVGAGASTASYALALPPTPAPANGSTLTATIAGSMAWMDQVQPWIGGNVFTEGQLVRYRNALFKKVGTSTAAATFTGTEKSNWTQCTEFGFTTQTVSANATVAAWTRVALDQTTNNIVLTLPDGLNPTSSGETFVGDRIDIVDVGDSWAGKTFTVTTGTGLQYAPNTTNATSLTWTLPSGSRLEYVLTEAGQWNVTPFSGSLSSCNQVIPDSTTRTITVGAGGGSTAALVVDLNATQAEFAVKENGSSVLHYNSTMGSGSERWRFGKEMRVPDGSSTSAAISWGTLDNTGLYGSATEVSTTVGFIATTTVNTNGLTIKAGKALKLNNAANTFATNLQSHATATANQTLTFPAAFDATVQLGKSLESDATGNLSWKNTRFLPQTTVVFADSIKTLAATDVWGRFPVDSTLGAITVILPNAESLQVGDKIQFYDPLGTWATNNVSISRSGTNLINGSSATRVQNVAYTEVTYTVHSTTASAAKWTENKTLASNQLDLAMWPYTGAAITGLGVGSAFSFDLTPSQSSITGAITHPNATQFVITQLGRYRLEGVTLASNAAGDVFGTQWYNVTSTAAVGATAYTFTNSGTTYTSANAVAIVDVATVPMTFELRVVYESGTSEEPSAGCYAYIVQIAAASLATNAIVTPNALDYAVFQDGDISGTTDTALGITSSNDSSIVMLYLGILVQSASPSPGNIAKTGGLNHTTNYITLQPGRYQLQYTVTKSSTVNNTLFQWRTGSTPNTGTRLGTIGNARGPGTEHNFGAVAMVEPTVATSYHICQLSASGVTTDQVACLVTQLATSSVTQAVGEAWQTSTTFTLYGSTSDPSMTGCTRSLSYRTVGKQLECLMRLFCGGGAAGSGTYYLKLDEIAGIAVDTTALALRATGPNANLHPACGTGTAFDGTTYRNFVCYHFTAASQIAMIDHAGTNWGSASFPMSTAACALSMAFTVPIL